MKFVFLFVFAVISAEGASYEGKFFFIYFSEFKNIIMLLRGAKLFVAFDHLYTINYQSLLPCYLGFGLETGA